MWNNGINRSSRESLQCKCASVVPVVLEIAVQSLFFSGVRVLINREPFRKPFRKHAVLLILQDIGRQGGLRGNEERRRSYGDLVVGGPVLECEARQCECSGR